MNYNSMFLCSFTNEYISFIFSGSITIWKCLLKLKHFYSHGWYSGAIRQRLSWDFAVATSVWTLLSTPSKDDKLVNLWVIAVTALVTREMICNANVVRENNWKNVRNLAFKTSTEIQKLWCHLDLPRNWFWQF